MEKHIIALTQSTPVLIIEGARSVGKTHLLAQMQQQGALATRVSLTDAATLRAAQENPLPWLRRLPQPFAIDEADRLYAKHMYVSLSLWQMWKTREECMTVESGLEYLPGAERPGEPKVSPIVSQSCTALRSMTREGNTDEMHARSRHHKMKRLGRGCPT